MDAQSNSFVQLLDYLATVKRQLHRCALDLKSLPQVLDVDNRLEPWDYPERGSTLEGYVEVNLRGGKTIAWLLRVTWNETQWMINTNVVVNESEWQETLKEFPESIATTHEGFLTELNRAVTNLILDINSRDFSESAFE
ncbi:MAG: hypothetical protein B6D41_00605 [Chloroflexi bacterium UTCFX4]|jgi:hypothetical protein|nr:MAG: hypothetical protein B6D41_00605 [Chloroflexi bacterium UTCFX4]